MNWARWVLVLAGVLGLGLAIFLGFGTDAAKALAWDTVTRPMQGPPAVVPWSTPEKALLATLSLDQLPPTPVDPSNRYADDDAAAELGRRLFFDNRFSLNRSVSCATCHQPERAFTDGFEKGRGIGVSKRNTRSLLGAAYSTWQYWDGRRDSLWAQALSPIEDPNEHGMARTGFVATFGAADEYRAAWRAVVGRPYPDFSDARRFPPNASPLLDAEARSAWQAMVPADRQLVNRSFATLGKFIAAYEARLVPAPGALDAYLAQVAAGNDAPLPEFGAEAIAGLRLFVDNGRCLECHNGPLLTNNEFHNTGILSAPGELPDRGRVDGVRLAVADPFNCLSEFSDDGMCAELRFRRTGVTVIGATRTPTLRGITATSPYMHNGQIATLAQVVDHYNLAEEALIGHNEAKPLALTPREARHLVAFLETLTPSLAGDQKWLRAPDLSREEPRLIASDAWSRATPPGSDTAAVYMSLTNPGGADVIVTDIDSDIGMAMIHRSVAAAGMMRMEHVDELRLAPGETLMLEPEGLHVMLTGLEADLVVGQTFALQLYAEDAEVQVEVRVRELSWVPAE